MIREKLAGRPRPQAVRDRISAGWRRRLEKKRRDAEQEKQG